MRRKHNPSPPASSRPLLSARRFAGLQACGSASALFWVLALASTSLNAAEPWTLSSRGYGPLTPGMSVAQAQQALGTSLKTFENQPLDPDCDHLYPASGHPGISLMVQAGRVTRISLDSPMLSTRSGLRVGDSAARVKAVLGRQLEIEAHKYDDDGQYFYVWEASRQRGVKFEIVGGRVQTIYAGDSSIQLVEGCA